MSLIRNYLMSLTRNAARDKFFTIINLLGLAIGITASILIFIYIRDQLTYDRYNEKIDRIYRVEADFTINGQRELMARCQFPLAPTLKDEYPEVEEYVRMIIQPDLYFEREEDVFKEDSIAWADSTIFRIFTIPFIAGDQSTALNSPYTMVISESLAKKYFGSLDVIGESMKALDGSNFTITGVFEDLPQNTHMRFNGLRSAATIEELAGTEAFNDRSAISFWQMNWYGFVLLAENTTPQMVLDKFPDFYDKYMAELGEQINASFDLRLTPLADVHFQKDEMQYDMPKGNMNYVYIMGIIGVLLIVIASINYTNLTTARATGRSREIGIRKVGGASRKILRSQFLGESIVMALVAGLLAAFLTVLALPLFNNLTSKAFDWTVILQPSVILFIVGISLLTGLLSGLYPSTFLASFDPVAILKGNGAGALDRGWLRRGLVILQFIISAVMIIGSVSIALQMRYIQHRDLGFDKEQILLVTLNDTAVINNVNAFREEIERHPSVEGTSLSFTAPGRDHGKGVIMIENNSGEMTEMTFSQIVTDYDYPEVMGIPMVEGRFYSRDFGSDQQNAVVVNEAVVRAMQWGDSVLGRKFKLAPNVANIVTPDAEVIGVIKDYNYSSLHNPVEPMVFVCRDNIPGLRLLYVRAQEGALPDVLNWVQEKRDAFNPSYPFQYSYLADELDEMYEEEHVVLVLVISFTLLIIFIAALGLLGLASFMTVKRTHETGIRRVMGASQNQILYQFLFQFSRWVIISNMIAWPVAYFVIKPWLQNFSYRIAFPYWTFILSLLLSLIIAIITVSWQSLKASRMNPAMSIRAE